VSEEYRCICGVELLVYTSECVCVQLQVENEQLYDELNSMVDEVRYVTLLCPLKCSEIVKTVIDIKKDRYCVAVQ